VDDTAPTWCVPAPRHGGHYAGRPGGWAQTETLVRCARRSMQVDFRWSLLLVAWRCRCSPPLIPPYQRKLVTHPRVVNLGYARPACNKWVATTSGGW